MVEAVTMWLLKQLAWGLLGFALVLTMLTLMALDSRVERNELRKLMVPADQPGSGSYLAR